MGLFNFFPKFQNQGGLLGTIGVTTTLDQAFGFLGSITGTGTGYNRPGDGSTQPTQQNNTLIYAGIAFAALIVVVLFVVLMNKK